MSSTTTVAATELREYWKIFRRAVRLHRPLAHEWAWTGDRIKAAGTALREYLGYDDPHNRGGTAVVEGKDVFVYEGRRRVLFVGCTTEKRAQVIQANLNELCPNMLCTAGTLTYAGMRGKRRRMLQHPCRHGSVSEWEPPQYIVATDSGLERSKPRRKSYKKPRAVIHDSTTVYIRHKGREVLFKQCISADSARLVVAKLNGSTLPVSKLERTLPRKNCPHCGDSVALNWIKRHIAHYHTGAPDGVP